MEKEELNKCLRKFYMAVSEIVCLRNQNIFNAHRIDCLVDRKGIGIESVIVSNFSQSKNTLYNLLYLLF